MNPTDAERRPIGHANDDVVGLVAHQLYAEEIGKTLVGDACHALIVYPSHGSRLTQPNNDQNCRIHHRRKLDRNLIPQWFSSSVAIHNVSNVL